MHDHPSRRSPTPAFYAGLVSVVGLVGACASEPVSSPPPKLPEAGPDGEYEVSLPQPPPPEPRYLGLELGAELDACDVEAPKFFYDGSEPKPQDAAQIEALAECLNTEAYREHRVLLVGKADPRGSDDYNRDLAMARADRIKELLVEDGVDPSRIAVQTAGESMAVGDSDEYSYGYDRRVDVIQLGLVVHP